MATVEEQPRFAGGGSAVAFERAAQSTERHRAVNRLSPLIAQWEVLITMFKHTVELPCLIGLSTAPSSCEHRFALVNLLTMGEFIWSQTSEGKPELLLHTGYDSQFVATNLNYLRSKYQDWYGTKDADLLAQDLKTIQDELHTVAK